MISGLKEFGQCGFLFMANLQLPVGVSRVRLKLGFPRNQARLMTIKFCRQARGHGMLTGWIRFLLIVLPSRVHHCSPIFQGGRRF